MVPNGTLLKKFLHLGSCFKRHLSKKTNKTSSSDYCIDLIKKNDHENYLCTLLLPENVRNVAIAIRAFNVEVSKAAGASRDPRIAAMRLNFWHETIERIYSGNPPNQPVALALSHVIAKHDLKKRQFNRLIKARERHLEQQCFSSLADMESYSEESVSPVIYLTLESAGIKDIHADHAASHVGKGQGLCLLLRVAGSGGGSWCLPKDLLESSGLNASQGIAPNSSLSKDLVFKVASRAKAHIDKARSLKSSLPRGSCIHLLPAVSSNQYLRRLRDTDFDVFQPILQERDFKLGLSLLWAKLTQSY